MSIAHQLIWILVSESKSGEDDSHGPATSTRSSGATTDDGGRPGIVSRLDLNPVDAAGKKGGDGPSTGHGFQKLMKGRDTLPTKAVALMRRIIGTFPPTARALLELQVGCS
jgi:hypothetical protein